MPYKQFNDVLISAFEQRETPFYFYDMDLLRKTLSSCSIAYTAYNYHVHYAMKANFNPKITESIQQAGFGADCVSGGEVKKAIEAGFLPSKIVFAGVGKSDAEIKYALEQDIFAFNVESIQELEVINSLASAINKKAKVALRINPNVDAKTHANITTGLDENKFGINAWELPDAIAVLQKLDNVEFLGIHFHIGSQILDVNVFKSLCVKVNEFSSWFEERGFTVKVLNVGGGLGIDYHEPDSSAMVDFDSFFKIFHDFLEVKPHQEVHFELGRSLVAPSGSLISRVLYVKTGIKKNFLILDAGMTHLMRPALYQAYHQIENLSNQNKKDALKYDVVGPICESTDVFGKEVELPISERGDLIAIRSTGAYGEVLASDYNLKSRGPDFFKE